jgi:hypothetical protein
MAIVDCSVIPTKKIKDVESIEVYTQNGGEDTYPQSRLADYDFDANNNTLIILTTNGNLFHYQNCSYKIALKNQEEITYGKSQ